MHARRLHGASALPTRQARLPVFDRCAPRPITSRTTEKLTQAEWTFLEPQVQEYNTALLARYGIDSMDFLTPIEMRLRERLQSLQTHTI